MTAFKYPSESFGTLDAGTAATLVASAADLALVLDSAGTVLDLAVPNRELSTKLGAPESWIGQVWAQLLNQASRAKAALLLADVAAGKTGKWYHLNHVGPDSGDVPVLYAAAPLRHDRRVVLFGRDLRPLSMLQQRLIDSQQSMERDHARMRQLELRYRMVLHTASDPLMVVGVASQKIVEVNAAFATLIGRTAEELVGQPVLELFAPADRSRITAAVAVTRASGHPEALQVTLADGIRVSLTPTLFREEAGSLLLLRLLVEAGPANMPAAGDDSPALLRLVEQAPDGYVVTDATGHVLTANAAFLAMAEIGRPLDAIGQSLDRWLGQAGVDFDVLLTNLRQRGAVRMFATSLTGSSGLSIAVEISAVALSEEGAKGAAFGFALRDVERRVAESRPGRELPRSVDQLTELIGRVALKDLVREATDMIERLCIEAALEMTNDNRASAAELLGLSRQSLYVKLHRYGLGDLAEAAN